MYFKFNKQILILFLLLFVLIVHCKEEACDKLEKEIRQAGADKDISPKECSNLRKKLQSNSKQYTSCFKDSLFSDDNSIIESKLISFIKEVLSQTRSKGEGVQISCTETSSNKPSDGKNIVNIIIENSLSMDGYIKGNTNFELAITQLLTNAGNSFRNPEVNLYILSNKLNKIPDNPLKYIRNLESNSKIWSNATEITPEFNEMFQIVLEERKDISVFISDCVYSINEKGTPKKKSNVDVLLGYQSNNIRDIFSDKLKEEKFGIVLIQLSSDFDGFYQDKNKKQHKVIGERPYYIWVISPIDNLKSIERFLDILRLEKYQNHFVFLPVEEIKPFFSILSVTNKLGEFKIDRTKSTSEYNRGIDGVEINSRNNDGILFQFSIAIDLSEVPLPDNYISDPNNYEISPKDVSISIKKGIKGVDRLDSIKVGKSTHIFTFSIKNKSSISTISMKLKNQLPKWIQETSSINDFKIADDSEEQKKTFGFQYLVEGVFKAFNPQDKNYFSIEIPIKR